MNDCIMNDPKLPPLRVVITSPIRIRCHHCNKFELPDIDKGVKAYFFGKGLLCGNCRARIDWWEAVQHVLQSAFNNHLFGMIGAKVSNFNIRLHANEKMELNLIDWGIPESAVVLHTTYIPHQQGLSPIVVEANSTSKYVHAKQVTIFGYPQSESVEKSLVHVAVTCVKHDQEEHSLRNMILAFDMFHNKQFERGVIPAQVAVEPPLYKVVEKVLQRHASKNLVGDFLSVAATYSHQLNVLLPMICKTNDFPILPDHIRGHMNQLRKYRNALAHSGMIKSPIHRKEMAELLAASLFTVSYLGFLDEHLEQKH